MKNTQTFKLILSIGILLLGSLHLKAAESLNLHVDCNRFLDAEGNTILLLDYQAVYRNLMFLAQSGGYLATLEVEVSIANQDSLLYSRTVTDKIGIRSKYDAASQRKSYLNRLVFQLNEPRFSISFKAKDINVGSEFFWDKDMEALPPFSRLSDIELNSRVYADSSSFLQKFQRQNAVYEPIPSVILSKSYSEYAYLYMELYSPASEIGSAYRLNLSLQRDGKLVMDEDLEANFEDSTDAISLKIPLSALESGKYSGTVSLLAGDTWENRDFEFVLSEDIEQRFRIFEDADDEYTLMRYFMPGNLPGNWAALDGETKTRYINNFWQNMAISTRMPEDEIIDLVQQRIQYANQHFSSLKAGWTSDMGRIYIRNGAPADIEKGVSSDETRFVRKDYQIWKYSSSNKPVYLFIDIQMNNNHRLIFVKGDDGENTNPDWMRFLGPDFDVSLLRN